MSEIGRRSSVSGLRSPVSGLRSPRYTVGGLHTLSLGAPSSLQQSMSHSYRTLHVWQQAMELVDVVYATVREFPREELFGLTSQMRRAAVSAPSNIAEGRGRRSFRDNRAFLRRARGSVMELETQIEIARRQHFISSEVAEALFMQTARVVQLINGTIRDLELRMRSEDRRPKTEDRAPR